MEELATYNSINITRENTKNTIAIAAIVNATVIV